MPRLYHCSSHLESELELSVELQSKHERSNTTNLRLFPHISRLLLISSQSGLDDRIFRLLFTSPCRFNEGQQPDINHLPMQFKLIIVKRVRPVIGSQNRLPAKLFSLLQNCIWAPETAFTQSLQGFSRGQKPRF